MQLSAIDGATLRAHDTVQNRDHFEAQSYVGDTVASYSRVQGVNVTSLPAHRVHSAAFGPYSTNEMLYATQLVEAVPDESPTVIDRGFLSAEILCGLTDSGTERHLVIPAKADTEWEALEDESNDMLVRMRVSPQARTKCPESPEFREARAITVVDAQARKRISMMSLRDCHRYKPGDIATCYDRRWAIGTSCRELKQTMPRTALTLRSKTVDGVYQEIRATLIAYKLVRLASAKAALAVSASRPR